MKIKCPFCDAVHHIPDALLPKGRKIAFQCKKCGERVQADPGDAKMSVPSCDVSEGKPSLSEKESSTRAKHDNAIVQTLKSKIRMSLMGFIPPVAHVITRAQAVMADPDAGMKDLAQVIETDPGITARALKVANSAYYGLSGKVTSITHASVLLGNKILGEIITMAGIRGFLGETLKGYGLESGILWRHSLAVAMGSRLIAEKRRAGLAEDAFVGGLIHDAGMIMLDSHLFERKEEFQAIIEDGSHSFLEGERMALGIDHSEVGAEMFREWGLPYSIVKPIASHHSPSSSGGELGYIIHMADILARKSGYGLGLDDRFYEMDNKAVEVLGSEKEELKMIGDEIGVCVERVSKEVLDEPL